MEAEAHGYNARFLIKITNVIDSFSSPIGRKHLFKKIVIVLSFTLTFLFWIVIHSPCLRYRIAEITGLFAALSLLFLSLGWMGKMEFDEDLLYLIPAVFIVLSYLVLNGYLVISAVSGYAFEFKSKGMGATLSSLFLKYPFVTTLLMATPFIAAGHSKYDPEERSLRIGFTVLTMFVIFEPSAISWRAPTLDYLIGQSILFYYHLIYTVVLFMALPFTVLICYKGIPFNYLGFKLPPGKRFFFMLAVWIPALIVILISQTATFGFPIKSYSFSEWFVKSLYVTFFIAFPMELMFRGLLIGVLDKVWTDVYGKNAVIPILMLIASSFFYALVHYWGGPYAIMANFAFGLVFGAAFLYTHSLWTPILLHALVLLMSPTPF